MYKMKIMDEAWQELRKEIRYSKKIWGLQHSRNYFGELKKQINSLKENPLLHPLRTNVFPGIRIKIYKGNQIIYQVQEKNKLVVVLAILSTHQNIDSNKLKQRKGKI